LGRGAKPGGALGGAAKMLSFRDSERGQVARGQGATSNTTIQQVTVVVKDERPEHFVTKLAAVLSTMS